MHFGKIDYLNLLPFDVFIKGYPIRHSGFKQFLNHKKTYPSKLNHDFLFRRIDAGFISSIAGYHALLKRQTTDCAIIGKQQVLSVLVLLGTSAQDTQSATSNALCQVLGLKGQVLIGDKALRYYYQKKPKANFVDLAQIWHQKRKLPFVFGRLCFRRHGDFYKGLARAFNKKPTKIPYYILENKVQQSQLNRQQILHYLKHIAYTMGTKEKFSLRCFYRELLFKGIRAPRRFA